MGISQRTPHIYAMGLERPGKPVAAYLASGTYEQLLAIRAQFALGENVPIQGSAV